MEETDAERTRDWPHLDTPPGEVVPDSNERITVRTSRRQEQLDRLAPEGDEGPQPPGEGEVDDRNEQFDREQLAERERLSHEPR